MYNTIYLLVACNAHRLRATNSRKSNFHNDSPSTAGPGTASVCIIAARQCISRSELDFMF